ncbi:MAG: dTDP-4-dehydrorhamnose reductase [Pseudomonadales bacterium]
MGHEILVLGATGQVGSALLAPLARLGQVITASRAQCDLSDQTLVKALLDDIQPDIIVNAAAYTLVDKAEGEQDQSFQLNRDLPALLADYARGHDALFVDYSTDYVFDGESRRPYTEDSPPNPLGVYGKSKLAGQRAVQASGCRHLLLRVGWVYSAAGNNFAKTILGLAAHKQELNVVADQQGTPTSAGFIAEITAQLIAKSIVGECASGLYHVAPSGYASWRDFASVLVQSARLQGAELALQPADIKPITAAEYPFVAPRPLNTRLDTTKLQQVLGRDLPHWQEPVDHIVNELIHHE